MSTHVKVWRINRWWSACIRRSCPGYRVTAPRIYDTHAEALAAAWAHIKEHS